jgi:hypothetical protein
MRGGGGGVSMLVELTNYHGGGAEKGLGNGAGHGQIAHSKGIRHSSHECFGLVSHHAMHARTAPRSTTAGAATAKVDVPDTPILCCSVSPDATQLALGTKDGRIIVLGCDRGYDVLCMCAAVDASSGVVGHSGCVGVVSPLRGYICVSE